MTAHQHPQGFLSNLLCNSWLQKVPASSSQLSQGIKGSAGSALTKRQQAQEGTWASQGAGSLPLHAACIRLGKPESRFGLPGARSSRHSQTRLRGHEPSDWQASIACILGGGL